MIDLKLPLYYQSSAKKKVLYSLNQFLIPLGTEAKRNTFHQYKAKKDLMKRVTKMVKRLKPIKNFPVQVTLTIFRPSDHPMDVGNISILEKYATDALVKAGILPDDSWKYIDSVTMKMGGINKENPHAIYHIEEP